MSDNKYGDIEEIIKGHQKKGYKAFDEFCDAIGETITGEFPDLEAFKAKLTGIVSTLEKSLERLSPVVRLIIYIATVKVVMRLAMGVAPRKGVELDSIGGIVDICKVFHKMSITLGDKQKEIVTEIESIDFGCFPVKKYISENIMPPTKFTFYD